MLYIRGPLGQAAILFSIDKLTNIMRWRSVTDMSVGQIRRDTDGHFKADLVTLDQKIVQLCGVPTVMTDISEIR